jgi:hypothetical protein
MTNLLKDTQMNIQTITPDKGATIKRISFNFNPFSHKGDNSGDLHGSHIILNKPKDRRKSVQLDITNDHFLQNLQNLHNLGDTQKKKEGTEIDINNKRRASLHDDPDKTENNPVKKPNDNNNEESDGKPKKKVGIFCGLFSCFKAK